MTILISSLLFLVNPALAGGPCEGDSPDIKGWKVTREVSVKAPAATVWSITSDYATWPEWTNWSKERDPEAQWIFEGDAGTVGHAMTWDGPKLKTGAMTVTTAEGHCMAYDLQFGKSKARNVGYLVVAESGDDASTVTWHTAGPMGGLTRLLFRGAAEKAIGADFDIGLKKLGVKARKAYLDEVTALAALAKAASESSAAAAAEAKTGQAEAKTALEAAKAEVDAAQTVLDKARRRAAKAEAQTALDAATAKHTAAEKASQDADSAAKAAEDKARTDAEAAESLAKKVAELAKP